MGTSPSEQHCVLFDTESCEEDRDSAHATPVCSLRATATSIRLQHTEIYSLPLCCFPTSRSHSLSPSGTFLRAA